MTAVIRTGGKQYRVAEGDVLAVEKLPAGPGERVTFDEVLMVNGEPGTPLVAGALVEAEVQEQFRGEKVLHFVKRRRKHGSKRTKGHRQYLTRVRITGIAVDGAGRTAPRKATEASVQAEAPAGSRPANLLDAPREDAPDDLKKISGIGPKIEAMLHEHGVFHYDQIAAWTEAEVAWMDEALSFHGRIAREGWIEQATTLAAEAGTDET